MHRAARVARPPRLEPRVIPTRTSWSFVLLAALAALLSACSNYEEKRIRELLHEKGFGSRAQGDATTENYIGGGDAVVFFLPGAATLDPSAAELVRLSAPQQVAIDGKILVPYVGPVQVLGLTEAQVATLVKGLLQGVFQFEIDVQARIVLDAKHFYAFGEVGGKGIHTMGQIGNDATLLKAMAIVGWTQLANLSRVQLIRPDAEHPLVVEVDLYRIITTGVTRYNLRLRENDILYVPPTFLGMFARLLERILAPVNVSVQTMLGLANLRVGYNVATGQGNANGFFFRF